VCPFLRCTEDINHSSESQGFFIFVLLLSEMRCVGSGKRRQVASLSFIIKEYTVEVNVRSSVGAQWNKVVCVM